MIVIGLTGGIASGKTTAAAALQAAGAPLVASDALARAVVAPGEPALEEVRAEFGPGVLAPDGRLDRRALATMIFADPAARRRLEAITHPRIHARLLAWLQAQAAAGAVAAVCDIPLLFEAGYADAAFLDLIWVVSAARPAQLERLMRRDGLDRAAAEARMAAQWPLEEKVRRADLVLTNDGPPEALVEQATAAWRALVGAGR